MSTKISEYAGPASFSNVQISGVVNGVKKYIALLSQSGGAAPTATVLENSLGGNVVWTRTGQGKYLGTLAGAFPNGKVHLLMGDYPFNVGSGIIFSGWNNANSVQVSTFDTANGYVDD